MSLADIFLPEAVIVGLDGDKPAVVGELVSRLVSCGRLPQADESYIVESILERETQGTTATGNGIAVPNCRTSSTEEFVGTIGLAPAGVPFAATDGEPVYAVFLLVAPLDRRDQYYEVLGKITALGADKGWRLKLLGCRTPDEVHKVLQEFDRR